jgi:isopenicillin N synthase-like dioxygenase
MGTRFTSIPLVDISGLRSERAEDRARVAGELARAARGVGFLYVTGHGVPEALFEGVRAMAERFFAQPLEAKMDVYIGRSTNHRGYVPEGEEVFQGASKDRKEPTTSRSTLRPTIRPAAMAMFSSGPTSGPTCPVSRGGSGLL